MTDRTLTRRQFLQGTTRIGLTLTLATALGPSPRPVLAHNPPQILISQGTDILSNLDVQNWIVLGLGGLWVAGEFLNSFARNLVFENLPQELKQKYRLAGGEYKSLPAARAIWKTIPASIRAEGAEALWKFHKDKDWSHIVPNSWGGPATAQNGTWWCSPCNRSLGPRPMDPADIASARTLLRFEGMRSTISQTIKGSAKGGMIGVIAGGLLAILEHGLDYAEGKITWEEMANKIVKTSIVAGILGFVIAGIIIGVSLAFPFLIPIFAPLLIVLQAVGLVFLGHQVIDLAVGWWKALDVEKGLETLAEVLDDVGGNLRRQYKIVEKNVRSIVWGWLGPAVGWLGIDWAWAWAVEILRRTGIYNIFAYFASQTMSVTSMATDFISSLLSWNYYSYVEVKKDDIEKSIADVVATEFQEAISTTDDMLRSIGDFQTGKSWKSDKSLLIY